MGKRSPILGYNHNVRYRGLVFHVQSEDSGVASPHLFTHLFHHGVIVSTRKLVYDAGSAEESIKSLMQAQHKAVLKDLRKGHFDDKIDSYLGGTPGLLPRGANEEQTEAQTRPITEPGEPPELRNTLEDVAVGPPTEHGIPMMAVEGGEMSAPVLITEKAPTQRALTPPPIPRLPTSERLSAQLVARGTAPSVVDTTLKTEAPAFAATTTADDLSPEIEIQLEVDDSGEMPLPRRATRDTEMSLTFPDDTRPTLGFDGGLPLPTGAAEAHRGPIDDTRPTLGMVNEEAARASAISDGIPGAIPRASSPVIPPPTDSRKLGVNAASLPAARPISRPPVRSALSQPQVVSRPATSQPGEGRDRRESEAVEVYSPAPSSAELPGERPGQYAQHKKVSTKIPIDGLKEYGKEPAKPDRSGGVAIPAGLGRPARSGTSPQPNRPPSSPPPRLTEPLRSRVPTPVRIAPITPAPARAPTGNGGVVMTRPAVIVGAPANKPTSGTIPRIRKAREDEGRGFGQGLISEKSLDEVILAYLSEDADEK